MDPREKNLSPKALSQASPITCALGGTILFDTRDLTLGAVRGRHLSRRTDLAPADRRDWICRRWSQCPPIMC